MSHVTYEQKPPPPPPPQSMQLDLERVALDAVRDLKKQTGETNLVFCGGVGLNR